MTSLEHYPEEIFDISDLERDDLKYKIINIVMISYISTKLNLNQLCNCLPIAEVDDNDQPKSGAKLNIPYFGYENIFVSASFDGENRGIRIIKKPFKCVLYVDFQCNKKNQHIKISNNNLHITGVRTLEVGINCIQKIINKIMASYTK